MLEKIPNIKKEENSKELKESSFNLDRSKKYLKRLVLMGVASLALTLAISNFDSASADQIEQQLEQLEEIKQRSLEDIRENGFRFQGEKVPKELTESGIVSGGGNPEHVRALVIYGTSDFDFMTLRKDVKLESNEVQEKPSLKELFRVRGLSSLYDYLDENIGIYEVASVAIDNGEFSIRKYGVPLNAETIKL
jgi:hypothetical protein